MVGCLICEYENDLLLSEKIGGLETSHRQIITVSIGWSEVIVNTTQKKKRDRV